MIEINRYIDHTLLRPTATEDDIIRLCEEAREYNFKCVCVNGSFVGLAHEKLKDTEVGVCAVVGFPLGAMSTEAKVYEATQAVKDGATEIDMVINIGALKSKQLQQVEQEIRAIKQAIGDKVLKVILETCYLTSEEINLGSQLAVNAQADYVKTSTGFGTAGASEEGIELMKKAVAGKAKLKASGGIKNLDTALFYIELGVERIGTSSGVSIVKEMEL